MTDDRAVAVTAVTVDGETAEEADVKNSGAMSDALEDLAELVDGPKGVREVSGRLDQAMHGRLSVVEECLGDTACFVEHRRRAGPPEEARALLEEYLGRVIEVWQEAARLTVGVRAEGGVAVVEAAQQWHEAAALASRAALAAVECLYDLEPEQFISGVGRCSYLRDLYAAAVLDHNRLRQEFERAYVAFIQSASAS